MTPFLSAAGAAARRSLGCCFPRRENIATDAARQHPGWRNAAVVFAVFAVLAVAPSSATASSDPRKCSPGRTPASCANTAAKLALQRHMSRVTGGGYWTSQIVCSSRDARLLAWVCSWNAGTSTVRFRALSSGWRTVVSVTCRDTSLRPAQACVRRDDG